MVFAILFSVLTTLSEGMFHTQYETEVDTCAEACNVVIDSMIYYLQTDPEMLSEQFFAGQQEKCVLSGLEGVGVCAREAV